MTPQNATGELCCCPDNPIPELQTSALISPSVRPLRAIRGIRGRSSPGLNLSLPRGAEVT